MECIACHKWLPQHSRFCPSCGEQQLPLFTAGASGIRVAQPIAHSHVRLAQTTPAARDVSLERMIPRVIVIAGSLLLGVLALMIWMKYSDRASSAAKRDAAGQTTTETAQSTHTRKSAQSRQPEMVEAGTDDAGDDSVTEAGSDADEKTGSGDGDSNKRNDGPLATLPVPPPPPPPNIILLSAAAAVPPDKYLYYEFSIARGYSSTSRVRGSFSSQGGGGDAIHVSITDAAGLIKLARGQQYKGWYRSGKSTDDQIDLRLAPGHYYVVVDNRGSPVSNKVKLDLKLVRDDN